MASYQNEVLQTFNSVRERCHRKSIGLDLLAVVVLLMGLGALALGQQPSTSAASPVGTVPHVVHVLGLENVKRDAKGILTVQGGEMQFESGKAKTVSISIPSIQDVFTNQDSKESVGGAAGTVAKLAVPYGGGRVLSLFQEKIDVLTLEYQDSNGGLHGVIFTLPKGQAAAVKKQLVAQGAHASVPLEAPTQQEGKQEKRP